MVKKRASSPRRNESRTRNRAERQAARKKVAAAATLAATLHGVRLASDSRLIARAREYAPQAMPPRQTWFDRLQRREPSVASELLAIVNDWTSHGEMRDIYPTMSSLHRFVVAEVTRVDLQAFTRWVNKVAATGGAS